MSEGLTLRHAGTNQCLDTVGGPGSQLMQYTCGQAAPANVQSWITVRTIVIDNGNQVTDGDIRLFDERWMFEADRDTRLST